MYKQSVTPVTPEASSFQQQLMHRAAHLFQLLHIVHVFPVYASVVMTTGHPACYGTTITCREETPYSVSGTAPLPACTSIRVAGTWHQLLHPHTTSLGDVYNISRDTQGIQYCYEVLYCFLAATCVAWVM